MEISQYTWSRQTVRKRWVSFEPFTPMEFLCQSASDPTSHIENQDVQSLKMLCQMCLKVTRPVLRISRSFEGHCALTNADEANEVQQNVVTAKKGKKRGIKAILRRFVIQNFDLCCFTGKVEYLVFFLGGGGDVELNYFPGYCFAIVISYCFSPAFLDSYSRQ